MINDECLKFNIKEYLDYCNFVKNVRGVGVITDKQSIFYSQVLKNDIPSHIGIVNEIENAIHPENQQNGIAAVRESNVYIFATGAHWFEIILPELEVISISQYDFLVDCIKQLEEYNKNIENEKYKVKFNIIDGNGNKIEGVTTEELKEKLKKYIVKNVVIEEEKILGKTLSEEKIRKNLAFHIDFSMCTTLKELYTSINLLNKYYVDEYYKNIFLELFPNYIEIRDVCLLLQKIGLDDDLSEKITFDNIKEKLYEYINNLFNKTYTYPELLKITSSIRRNDINGIFEKQYLNFKYFIEFVKNINFSDEELANNALTNVKSYNEMFNVLFEIMYNRKLNELKELENKLETNEQILKYINVKNIIVNHKEEINDIFEKVRNYKKSLYDLENEFNLCEINIEIKNGSINKYNNVISEHSNGILNKIFKKNKINTTKQNLELTKIELEELAFEKENLIIKIDEINEQIENLQAEFKRITQLDFFPTDEEVMEYYYNENKIVDEEKIIYIIEDVLKNIEKIKEELLEYEKAGLINISDEIILENNEEKRKK